MSVLVYLGKDILWAKKSAAMISWVPSKNSTSYNRWYSNGLFVACACPMGVPVLSSFLRLTLARCRGPLGGTRLTPISMLMYESGSS
jgi:hypothetical protein